MHIILCGATFSALGSPIDDFISLVWTKRWYEPGTFKTILPAEYFTQADAATFIYNSDKNDYMLIDEIELNTEDRTLTISGTSLEALFDWRVMYSPTYYSAHYEDSVRFYVDIYATDSFFATLAFTNTPVTLATAKGYTDTGDAQTKAGAILSEQIRAIYKPLGWAYTLTKAAASANLVFDTVKGLDRRSTQSTNQQASFLSSRGDIGKVIYRKNNKDYKNYVFFRTTWPYESAGPVAEGSSYREYDASLTGEENRYIYFTGDKNYTTAQMDALCKAELTKYPVAENATGEISPVCALVYGTDYSLGDYCDFVDSEFGISFSAQITAVDFVYENGAKRTVPIFGEETTNIRKFVKREAGKL